ncbi:MAG: four-carbon acid sugar kinase family protein [Janthinobacterium lividum]
MAGLVIVADDLSGAADCGIVCTQAGLDTLVILGDRTDVPDVAVLSIDADTRGRPEAEAVAVVAALTRRHGGPERLLFKKLDSTLRGHVGAELAAMLRTRRESGPAFIVMAPAFPATGRSTVGGMQLLHGTPLQDTEIWQREAMMHRAHVPEMLERAGLRTAQLDLDTVRGGGLARALADAALAHDAVVCDAAAEDDLRAIAVAGMSLGRGTIWAGSAGLARYLPEAAGLTGNGGDAAAMAGLPAAEGPILFVVGSLSGVSRAQVSRLAAADGIALVSVPPAVLRTGPGDPGWLAQEAALEAALGSGRDVVALIGSEAQATLSEGLALCHALARLVAPHAGRIGALVSTGGETARAVLQAFGSGGLHLVGEIEPGVPLSHTEGGRRLPVVTKAGAFGHPDTLLRCRAVLRAGSSSSPLPMERSA